MEQVPTPATMDLAAFERATTPLVRSFSPEQARQIIDYRADTSLQSRIEELAEKCNEGELTDEERVEYAGYVAANKFVAILQAQARKLVNAGA